MEGKNPFGQSSGILRVDITTPAITRVQQPVEPPSPQPSVDRLSVSFAPDYEKSWSEVEPNNEEHLQVPPAADASIRVNVFNMADNGDQSPSNIQGQGGPSFISGNRLSAVMTDEDDDYSASMAQILQRRASQIKVKGLGKRRTSSPFDSEGIDRRRSSVFTTSSGDTAITMDGEGQTQDQIFENIRLHKELLESVKQQPWEMKRKLKLVQQAKEYVKRHEGQLEERLAQSKSTKDIMARFNILLLRFWAHFKREATNLFAQMIPWELRIKEIESHFGSVVASYFTFLRWVFWINIVISAILICFVIVPEMFAADPKFAGQRKILLPSEEERATHLGTLWEFEGVLKYSPMFYGYYTDQKQTKEGYPLPLSYFVTGLAVYIYSFVAILRRMADNSRQSKLSEKEDELFTAWDYMIGNPETAFNRFASITMGFKESLLEEKEKKKDERNWKVIGLRVLANILIILLLMSSACAVILVVDRSKGDLSKESWWRQNEITLSMSLITTIFPNIFELVGMLEKYHPRRQLRWQLARIMVLNFLNLYTLIFALFGKVSTMTEKLQELQFNATVLTSTPVPIEKAECADVMVNCSLLQDFAYYESIKGTKAILVFFANLTTIVPGSEISQLPNNTWSNTIGTANSNFNITEWWSLYHSLSPKTDISTLINASTTFPAEYESIAGFLENENYTYWTNQSNIDLNETNLWMPENRTAFVTSLPLLIKLISSYISSVLPTLQKTTQPITFNYTNENTTTGPPLFSSSTLFPEDFDFSNITNISSIINSTMATNTSEFTTIESNRTNYIDVYIATTPSNEINNTTKRRRKGKGKGKGKGGRNGPKLGKRHVYLLNGSGSSDIDDMREVDYPGSTMPDWGRYYPTVEDEYISDRVTESQDEDEDEEENGNLYVGSTGQILRGSKAWTRGDITIPDETTTTTMMPTTKPPIPENLDKFLTNVRTIVTMIFSHNSTKIDEIDYSRMRDFSKWITTLESYVETRKVTAPYNSTFETTVKVNIEDKDIKNKCYIQVCENGTTIPEDIPEYLNCTTKDNIYACTLSSLLGPRDDNCWIPSSPNCITTTELPPTIPPDISLQLRDLCWETMFGQELVKLTVMDLIFTVGFIFVLDFFRAILVRVLNPCWCWDLEKKFPQYGDFKIAENILHLVNNQGMIWMGMFFSPGIPALNLFKLVVLMYIRSWAVMTCNVPHETVFRASRSNNFYFALLLFMLFLCTLPVAYAVTNLHPSWHCGPFSKYVRIYQILTQAILSTLPESMHKVLDYIASPGIVIPLLVLLILIIYYLLSLTGALREANNDLKIQLRRERTEERRKMFKLAGGKKKDIATDKWRMLIPMAAKAVTGKSNGEKRQSVLTTGKMTGFAGAAKRAALKAKQLKEAAQEDDGNATDIDQVSLPEDNARKKRHHKSGTTHEKTHQSQPITVAPSTSTRKPSCTDSVTSRSEIPVIKISKDENDDNLPPTTKQEMPSTSAAALSTIKQSGGTSVSPVKKKRVLQAFIKASKEFRESEASDGESKEEENVP